jgi:hypothetical protein
MTALQTSYLQLITMTSEDGAPQKRHATEMDEPEDAEDQKAKRAKIDVTSGDKKLIPTTSMQFYPFHLQMLRALYEDMPSDIANRESQCAQVDDGKVDANLWQMISVYIQERDDLQMLTDEANNYRGIHEEAVRIHEEAASFAEKNDNLVSASPWAAAGVAPAPNQVPSTFSFYSSQFSSPQSTHRYSNSILSGSQIIQEMPGRSFGVIAGLLERKFCIVNSRLKCRTKPFQPLLLAVERRLDTLGKLLRKQENILMEKDQTRAVQLLSPLDSKSSGNQSNSESNFASEQAEQVKARIEAKIRLWNLLLNGLKDTA